MDSHVHARSADLARYVDEGITTVRNLWGFAGLLQGAAALVRDGAVAPTIESASPGVDGQARPGRRRSSSPIRARRMRW